MTETAVGIIKLKYGLDKNQIARKRMGDATLVEEAIKTEDTNIFYNVYFSLLCLSPAVGVNTRFKWLRVHTQYTADSTPLIQSMLLLS